MAAIPKVLPEEALTQVLKFDPHWWWDPVPPFIRQHLDRGDLLQIAHVQLTYQRDILQAQLKANEQIQAVINRVTKDVSKTAGIAKVGG